MSAPLVCLSGWCRVYTVLEIRWHVKNEGSKVIRVDVSNNKRTESVRLGPKSRANLTYDVVHLAVSWCTSRKAKVEPGLSPVEPTLRGTRSGTAPIEVEPGLSGGGTLGTPFLQYIDVYERTACGWGSNNFIRVGIVSVCTHSKPTTTVSADPMTCSQRCTKCTKCTSDLIAS